MTFVFGNTKFQQTFAEFVSNQYTHFDVSDMPDVTASYGTQLDFISVLGNFLSNPMFALFLGIPEKRS